MVAAVEMGFPQAEIATSAYRFQQAMERGERVMVGVNAFASSEDAPIPTHRVDGEVELTQIARVRELRATRDASEHELRLAGLRLACTGDDNVMPHLIACAHAGATLGEMCDVFRSVWGVYRDPGGF